MARTVKTITSTPLEFYKRGSDVPLTITVAGLSGAEVAAIEIKAADAFIPVTDEEGTVQQFTATITTLLLTGSGDFRIDAGTPSGAVTATLDGNVVYR